MQWFPSPWAVLLAFGLDLILGDPLRLPHPVRWMGLAITRLEPWFRKMPLPLVVSGGCLTLILVLFTFLLCHVSLSLAQSLHPLIHFCLETVLIFYCLSLRSLGQAAMDVSKALRQDLKQARQKLGLIVGREVDQLSETEVVQGAVETVAENFVDGVLSPLFYAVLGGAPLALAFKMINTLDSMIGYKNSRYRNFGRIAARTDDAANFLPARLSIGIIGLASWLGFGRFRSSFQTALQEGKQHPSPNAGLPEAAFAGSLQVRLGGPNRYHGQIIDKPFIGQAFQPPGPGHIAMAVRLLFVAAFLSLILASVFLFGLMRLG